MIDLIDDDSSGEIQFPEFLAIINGGGEADGGGCGEIGTFFKKLDGRTEKFKRNLTQT
jgi:hypothetical protein